jgi:hypothetical protein
MRSSERSEHTPEFIELAAPKTEAFQRESPITDRAFAFSPIPFVATAATFLNLCGRKNSDSMRASLAAIIQQEEENHAYLKKLAHGTPP